MNGGQGDYKETTIDEIPLFIKSGSIIPIGPEVQYATERDGTILRFAFIPELMAVSHYMKRRQEWQQLWEGLYSTILFKWDDHPETLL